LNWKRRNEQEGWRKVHNFVLFTKYYSNYQIKDNDMDGRCRMHWIEEKYKVFFGKSKGKKRPCGRHKHG
jgi:hypothetical protein